MYLVLPQILQQFAPLSDRTVQGGPVALSGRFYLGPTMSDSDTYPQHRPPGTPQHADGHLPPTNPSPTAELESGIAGETPEFESEAQCGSLALGKQRNQEAAVTTEPEKHLTPRAAAKEFSFPKSN